jgi:hypothetical protein
MKRRKHDSVSIEIGVYPVQILFSPGVGQMIIERTEWDKEHFITIKHPMLNFDIIVPIKSEKKK